MAPERERVSAIAHGGHPIAGPLDEERVAALIGGLALEPGATVLDVGCGPGEWLLRILERFDARGVGVDRSTAALARARAEAGRRLAPGGWSWCWPMPPTAARSAP